MSSSIAVVGLACEFPGSSTPEELWETVLQKHRWFRNLPPQRLSEAYLDVLGSEPDTTCQRRAAVIEGYEIPLARFSLGEKDLDSADLTHWLALDCATRALDDAGLGDHLPRDTTRVILGNTLNGESSRADLLRLRWPYVRKTLQEAGVEGSEADWKHREHHFKARLAKVRPRTLAGALPNVIAGRITQFHDLKGGAFTVDAACASSLVAVSQACSALVSGEIDCAVVGGVDISLDPLELVGFTEAGALAKGREMRVFDSERSGFLPGEGCGFAVLLRANDPLVEHTKVRATLSGWGVSSDGRHDLTAPSPEGQRLALEKAYQRAGVSIDSVALFEAHGTGTEIGDEVEVSTLLSSLNGSTSGAAIGSIKANIGHTKAAAGMAGLIKAIKALETATIPPVTGCHSPMEDLKHANSLRLAHEPEDWPENAPRRAGVSGFGFGGVNAHVVVEGASTLASNRPSTRPLRTSQTRGKPATDKQLFTLSAASRPELLEKLERLREQSSHFADAQFEAASHTTRSKLEALPYRSAIIASHCDDLTANLTELISAVRSEVPFIVQPSIFFSSGDTPAPTEEASSPEHELASQFIAGSDPTTIRNGFIPTGQGFDLNWNPRFFTNPCERSLKNDSAPETLEETPPPTNSLEAIHRVLGRRKGDGYTPSDQPSLNETLSSLGVDSLGILDLVMEVEEFGFKARSEAHNQMSISDFAAIFGAPDRSRSGQTLSDRLLPWARIFEVTWQPAPLLPTPTTLVASWKKVGTETEPAPPTQKSGTLLIECFRDPDPTFLSALLGTLRDHDETLPVVFVDSTDQVGGFAKCLSMDHPNWRVLVIHCAADARPSMETLSAELADLSAFREVRYDSSGNRFLPEYRLAKTKEPDTSQTFGRDDVVLITGGAKGITAECMLALAEDARSKFAIIGRSPADDASVEATCDKLHQIEVEHGYWSADLRDAASTAAAVASIEERFGEITSIIHGSGINQPGSISNLTVEDLERHRSVKVEGLKNLLNTVPSASLKRIIGFGSVIARIGYRRSAAYALANDQLARLLSEVQSRDPHILCQTLDWSAWSETGMGIDLHALQPLKEAGVDPLATSMAVELFMEAIRHPSDLRRPILTGRLPSAPTIHQVSRILDFGEGPEAQVLSHTPNVELCVSFSVSLDETPWLAGHTMKDGKLILPGMFALELMERVAAALSPASGDWDITGLTLHRPISLPREGALELTVQAICDPKSSLGLTLTETQRSTTDSAVAARLTPRANDAPSPEATPQTTPIPELVGLELANDVYTHLLFHRDDFQRIDRYEHAGRASTAYCLTQDHNKASSFQRKVLNRDAFIHGIQVCVPNDLLLPAGVAKIVRHRPSNDASRVVAVEAFGPADGTYTYNVSSFTPDGQPVEVWTELELKRYSKPLNGEDLPNRLASIIEEQIPTEKESSHKPYYEYRHTVGFKETNLVGNVYFTNHLEWQGRCREMFLHEHALDVLRQIQSGDLILVTVSCSCEYSSELQPFDKLSIRMTLDSIGEDWAKVNFEYWRQRPGDYAQVANGTQMVASRQRIDHELRAVPLPVALADALKPFHGRDEKR